MKKTVKKGFTLIELTLVLVILGLLVGAAITNFGKVFSPTQATNEYSRTMQVIGAAERAAGDNAGQYPIASAGTAVSATASIAAQMGGNTADLAGWTYSCVGTTATITTATLESSSVTTILSTKVSASSPNWVPTPDTVNKIVTFVKTNVTCA